MAKPFKWTIWKAFLCTSAGQWRSDLAYPVNTLTHNM